MIIQDCEGYKKLLAAVDKDVACHARSYDDCHKKLYWIVERARHYGTELCMDPCEILNAWEKDRSYWYMNYYQDCNQPEIKKDGLVRVFENLESLHTAIGDMKFRCPMCGGVSKSPYECDSGKDMSPGKVCDWKSWGLFGTMGKGVFIYVKSELKGQEIFMPLSWEVADG